MKRVRDRTLGEIGIVAAIACVLGVLGVLLPEGMALGERIVVSLIGFLAAWALVRLLAIMGEASARLLGLSRHWGYAFAIPLAAIAIALVGLWLLGGSRAAMGEAFAPFWLGAIGIGIGFHALFFTLYRRLERAGEHPGSVPMREPDLAGREAPTAPGLSQTKLHERLPPGFPPILALTVEDHYVRVIAQDRSAMVLMPLAEAIALMPLDAGARVHRSWWVAKSATQGHRREGRDTNLRLVNGITVPVSRSRVKELRQRGWLSDTRTGSRAA